jgi:hypothetical protein
MRISHFLPSALGALVLLSGCAGTSIANRERPDEMAATRQPPLVIPPDFTLTPPAPGTAASAQSSSQQEALDAMFGGPAPRSGGETSLLDQAGRAGIEVGIRSSAGDNRTLVLDKGKAIFDIVAAPEGDGENARAAAGG